MERTLIQVNGNRQAYIAYYDCSKNYMLFAFLNNGETHSLLYSGKTFKTFSGAERCMKKFLNS